MENTNITEDVDESQMYIVNMRKKYSKTIFRYYGQNNKIEIKSLEKHILKPEARFEIPKEFTLEDNLVNNLNEDLVDKQRVNELRDRLKNLDKITMQNIRMRNCDIYKQVTENTM